jgi:hypothetical protein
VLATFGKGSWAAVGLDALSLVTFSWGRGLLRAGDATVEAADDIGLEGLAARADTISAGLRSGKGSIENFASVAEKAESAEAAKIVEQAEEVQLPGIFGKFSEKADFLEGYSADSVEV